MIEYNKIDISEGIDVNKTSSSRECRLCYCYYYYFLDINFNYEKYLCDGCHDMPMKANSMHNLAIAYNKGNAYHINFVFISKDNACEVIKNANIVDKKRNIMNFACF